MNSNILSLLLANHRPPSLTKDKRWQVREVAKILWFTSMITLSPLPVFGDTLPAPPCTDSSTYCFEELVHQISKEKRLRDRLSIAALNQAMDKSSKLSLDKDLGYKTSFILQAGRSKFSIILVHGLYGSGFQFAAQHFLFHALGFNIINVVLPGHDESKGKVTFHDWRKTLYRAVQYAKVLGEKVLILGESTGGLLAFDHYLNYGDVDGLILLEPALDLEWYSLLVCPVSQLNDNAANFNFLSFITGIKNIPEVSLSYGCEVRKLSEIVKSKITKWECALEAWPASTPVGGRKRNCKRQVQKDLLFDLPTLVIIAPNDRVVKNDILFRLANIYQENVTGVRKASGIGHGGAKWGDIVNPVMQWLPSSFEEIDSKQMMEVRRKLKAYEEIAIGLDWIYWIRTDLSMGSDPRDSFVETVTDEKFIFHRLINDLMPRVYESKDVSQAMNVFRAFFQHLEESVRQNSSHTHWTTGEQRDQFFCKDPAWIEFDLLLKDLQTRLVDLASANAL